MRIVSKKHEMHTGYDAVKDRLAGGPQEASWSSKQIIIVISISRWDSANNNIDKVISILSTQLPFPESPLAGKGIAIPGKGHLLWNASLPSISFWFNIPIQHILVLACTHTDTQTHTQVHTCEHTGLLKWPWDNSSLGSSYV